MIRMRNWEDMLLTVEEHGHPRNKVVRNLQEVKASAAIAVAVDEVSKSPQDSHYSAHSSKAL